MPRYFAFLRGINVGGHRVKMDRLRELIEALGLLQVETFIASGNVIFSSPSDDVFTMELEIARHLHDTLGYEVATHIRSQRELESIAAFEPREPPSTDSSEYVIFLAGAADVHVRRSLEDLNTETDRFEFAGREAYWLIRGKLSDSPLFGKDLTKVTGDGATTMRNINTIRRLVAKYPTPDCA
jgi:uncharacterized protein (DUF1697 family)